MKHARKARLLEKLAKLQLQTPKLTAPKKKRVSLGVSALRKPTAPQAQPKVNLGGSVAPWSSGQGSKRAYKALEASSQKPQVPLGDDGSGVSFSVGRPGGAWGATAKGRF